jgi:carbamoyltransferase
MDLNQISRPGGTSETWIGYHPSLVDRLGPPRLPDEPLEDRHRDIAADLQKLVEDFGFAFMRRAIEMTGCRNVAFAGGVALNAVMNGKIARSGLVDNIFIQPEAGDSGGALGAAYMAYQRLGHDLQPKAMEHAYWGAGFTDEEIEAALAITKVRYEKLSREDLILADPRDREMNLRVNAAVKYRDDWRPFAPSMIEEVAGEYMEGAMYAPFMIMTFPVKEEKKKDIAAVVHVDGTTRPQTVRRSVNPLYYDMIKRLGEKTGVPVVMNTSFNLKGEPVVNSPRDALRTFFSSGLDVLALGSFIIRK